jgi:Ca2+-dependent lipid-binding protein
LPAGDDDGSSDPFIKFTDADKNEKKTEVIYKNLNPLFY